MPLTPYLRSRMLDILRNQSGAIANTYVSLHTGDPGTTGASEVSGGSPAYARVATTWNAASTGAIDNSNTPVLNVPGSTTVTHVGLFDASTAGNFLASAQITPVVYASQGTFTLNDGDMTLT